jgi:hypothetical protein
LESAVSWLQALGAGNQTSPQKHAFRSWTSEELLLYFRAATLLKDLSALPMLMHVLGAARLASVPGADAARGVLSSTTAAAPAPSRSTLQRLALTVDAASMLHERHLRSLEPMIACYGWADASPQGGREWLLSKIVFCRGSSLSMAALMHHAHVLHKGARNMPDVDAGSGSEGELAEVGVAARNDALLALRSNLQKRTLPPTALGLRQTNLAHKCAALVHAVALETGGGFDAVDDVFASFVSFTTDFGTEVGIPGFATQSLCNLLPSWMQVARTDQGLQADGVCLGIPSAPATSEVYLEQDSPCTVRYGVNDLEPYGWGFAQTSSTQPTTAEQAKPLEPLHDAGFTPAASRRGARPLMANALPIPGALHIISNLLADVDAALRLWESFSEQMRNLAALLCDKLRLERFVATCLNSEDWQVVGTFSKTLPRPYDKRWGSITLFLRRALPLLPIIRSVWVETDYIASDSGKTDDTWRFDPAALTLTLSSLFFQAFTAMVPNCNLH